LDEEYSEEKHIRLIDVGEAFPQNVVPEKLAQASVLRASQPILSGEFDQRVDMWWAGLIVRLFCPQ